MEQFDLLRLGHFIRKIGRMRCVCSQEIYSFDTLENVTDLLCLCEELAKYCGAVGFRNAESEAILLLGRIRQRSISLAGSALEARLDTLERMLIDDARKSKYFQMSSDDAEYLNPLLVFGLPAAGPFPSASIDFQDACSCIAFGMWTAAVFHLMRIVEFGLRAFAADLGLSDVVINQPNTKTIPMEYAQWEQILNQLPEKIKTKTEALPKGPQRQAAQEFYYSAHKEIEAFKNAWRNHVMHSRAAYTREDAVAVLSHVKRFLNSLVEHDIAE
jgi:hypothetical protein